MLDPQEEIQQHCKQRFSAVLLGLVFGRLLELELEQAEATPKARQGLAVLQAEGKKVHPPEAGTITNIRVLDSPYGYGVVKHLDFK